MTAYPNFYYVKDCVRKVWMGEADAMAKWTDAAFVPI